MVSYKTSQSAISFIEQKYNIKYDDLILFPNYGKLYLTLFKGKGHYIDFDMSKIAFPTIPSEEEKLFGKKFGKKLTQKNSRELLRPYLMNSAPSPYLEEFLEKNYFDKMKKGQRVFAFYDLLYLTETHANFLDKTRMREYNNVSLYYMLLAKVYQDTFVICAKNLKLEQAYKVNTLRDDYTKIFVFVKE